MKVLLAVLTLLSGVLAAPSPQAAVLPDVPFLTQTSPPQSLPIQQAQVWPILPYSYSYTVSDQETGNYHNKAEIMNELGEVFGSYSVLMPDNIIYTTTYNITGNSGFVARVEKSLPQPAPPPPPPSVTANAAAAQGSIITV